MMEFNPYFFMRIAVYKLITSWFSLISTIFLIALRHIEDPITLFYIIHTVFDIIQNLMLDEDQ